MALNWRLGDFATGQITRNEPLPVKQDGSEYSLDIHAEDTAEVGVTQSTLTTYERNNWQSVFAPILTCMILDNDEKAWNEDGAIEFMGFSNKLSNEIKPNTISVQLAGVNEYLKARIIGEVNGSVSDPNTAITFTGATWTDVATKIIMRAFDATLSAADAPKPPQILSNVPAWTDGSLKKVVKVVDAKTYWQALTEVSDEAGGLEWRIKPRYASAARDAFVCDFILGTPSTPHIGEDTTVPIYLTENDAKFSGFQTTIDSNELYSKLYAQSKAGDEEAGSGADFTAGSVSASEFPILVERFFNAGVELTPEELSAQISTRLGFAAKIKYENSFTIEEQKDASLWRNRLGNALIITGLNNTISAGHSAIVRCVGITRYPGTDTTRVELMQLGPTYPRLPKDRVGDLLGNDSINSAPLTMPTTGGGGTPVVPPTGGWGVDGVITPAGKFGSEGRNPWDNMPPKINNPKWTSFVENEDVYDTFDGAYPFDPVSTSQSEGNRVYALDHLSEAVATKFNVDYTPETNYNGGINKATGMPNNGWKPIYVKKFALLPSGGITKAETVAEITSDQLKSFMPEWDDENYYNGGYYRSGYFTSNWVASGKFFIAFGFIWDHGAQAIMERLSDYDNYPWQQNSKRSCVFKTINPDTGLLEGDWQPYELPKNYSIPTQNANARFGDNIIFTGTSEVSEIKWKNQGEAQVTGKLQGIYDLTGYKLSYPRLQGQMNNPPGPFEQSVVANVYAWPWYRSHEGNTGNSLAYIKNFKTGAAEQYITNAPLGVNQKNWMHSLPVDSDGMLAVVSSSYGSDTRPWFKALEVDKISSGDFTRAVATSGSVYQGYDSAHMAVIRGWIVQSGWVYSAGKRTVAYKISESGVGDSVISDDAASNLGFYRVLGDGNLQVIDCFNQRILTSYDRYFWTGDSTPSSAFLISASRFFSYDGRLYSIVLSGSNKIKSRSVKMVEA